MTTEIEAIRIPGIVRVRRNARISTGIRKFVTTMPQYQGAYSPENL